MRAAAFVLAIILAGCAEPALPPPPPETIATDCIAHPEVPRCSRPTERSPLGVRATVGASKSTVVFFLANNGTAPLAPVGDPPEFSLYLRDEGGAYRKVADDGPGEAPGRSIAPGEEDSYTLHYGRTRAGDREKDVGHAVPDEPEPWPAGAYRACFPALVDGLDGAVRACIGFRVR